MAFCYGTSFNSAEEIENGTYNKTLYGGDDAYYKIYCQRGDRLEVTLTMQAGSDLDLYIYDHKYELVDWSITTDDYPEECGEDIEVNGWHYIKVYRYEPESGTVAFTLVISGASGRMIPGFGIMLVLISLGVLGLLLNKKKRSSRKEYIF